MPLFPRLQPTRPLSSPFYSMQGHMVYLSRYRAASGERNFIEQIKVPISLEAVLATEIIQEPQSNLEQKINSIFTLIAPVLLDRSNETSWIFPALKSTSHFLLHSTVSHRSDSSSEASSSCWHGSDAWSRMSRE